MYTESCKCKLCLVAYMGVGRERQRG